VRKSFFVSVKKVEQPRFEQHATMKTPQPWPDLGRMCGGWRSHPTDVML
jgi:hypothetical protein